MNQKLWHIILMTLLITLFNNIYSLNDNRDNCPVTIFYGLNESHSNDWAQCSNSGLIGISYYDKYSQNLIFRSITPNETVSDEVVFTGSHLEVNVLLFDSADMPHIFVAESNESTQKIIHFYKLNGTWLMEIIYTYTSETGQFIYELSGAIDNNNKFHLLILKTVNNPDSENYYMAFADAHLFYLSNSTSLWENELIYNYNTIWTMDEYSKMMNRQDIAIDHNNKAHVIFGEQINAMSSFSPSRLCYATKNNGNWIIETAFTYNANTRDDAGWYPSIEIDQNNHPAIGCCYIARVSSGSALSAKLYYLTRSESGLWQSEIVCSDDDGYFGTDGNDYTGALVHLKFDNNNNAHIIFSDIASSHANMNYFNIGNIRYACKSDNAWNINTIYRQNLPLAFFNAVEIYDMCLLISQDPLNINVIAQELTVNAYDDYQVELIKISIENLHSEEDVISPEIMLQNYPNPFSTSTKFIISTSNNASNAQLEIYNIKGQKIDIVQINTLKKNNEVTWNNKNLINGIYFAILRINGKISGTRKIILLK